MSSETERKYYLQDGREVSLRHLIAKEPEWARNRIIEGEKAITHNAALRKALLTAQCRLRFPLNLVRCKGFRELMLKIDETLKETEV